MAMMVRDPRDRDLPSGFEIAIQNPNAEEKIIIDTSKIRDKFKAYVRSQEAVIKDKFIKLETDFIDLQTDTPFIEPIIALFRRRQMRWR